MSSQTAAPAVPDDALRPSRQHHGDSVFRGLATGSGAFIAVILAAVAIFLIIQAAPAFSHNDFDLGNGSNGGVLRYVGPFVFGTLYSSVLALIIAIPVGVGIALFIALYAPRRLASGLGYIIDLLAAVPSVVYGLWGLQKLSLLMQPILLWLSQYLGFIPLFGGRASGTGRTMLTAVVVLAVMVLPIITSMTREIFLQVPSRQIEASLALGATRWEMIRQVIFPYSQSGIISASMLALGRALGETMAVAMVLSTARVMNFSIITSTSPGTIASNIALSFPEATGITRNLLIATGLVLFVITFVVNFVSRWVVNRRAEFSGAN